MRRLSLVVLVVSVCWSGRLVPRWTCNEGLGKGLDARAENSEEVDLHNGEELWACRHHPFVTLNISQLSIKESDGTVCVYVVRP